MVSTVLVVPCYNEERRLPVDQFRALAGEGGGRRVIFVDDGSTDGTAAVLAELCRAQPQTLSLLRLERNAGKAEAVRRGFLEAFALGPQAVGFWDADLSTPLTALPAFEAVLAEQARIEMVLGSRVKLLGRAVRRRLFRHYLGRVFATFASMILRLPVYDTQCGAKLFRVNGTLRQIFARPFVSRWIFDVEILARLIRLRRTDGGVRADACVYEVVLDRWVDVAGSKVRPWHVLRVIRDLWVIHRYLRRGPR